ncbi:LuxR C-terminal-related transcriptional regulator [Streptomyces sp. NPDC045470]|uniref:helix-turn-helix transcriptional regulator n=1 Tax=Streptomyces sp. NPDC045470 TaxID=3155469 RepID=UPI0033F03E56
MTLRTQYDKLTPTEVRGLPLLADGKSTAAAAAAMGIKPETLMNHLRRVRNKVGDGSRAHVLHRCYTKRLLPLPMPGETPVFFTLEERRVWTVVATYPISVRVPGGTTRDAIRALMKKAGAASEPHLIKLGHQYGLLTGPDHKRFRTSGP